MFKRIFYPLILNLINKTKKSQILNHKLKTKNNITKKILKIKIYKLMMYRTRLSGFFIKKSMVYQRNQKYSFVKGIKALKMLFLKGGGMKIQIITAIYFI
jgi:hypothetical protein